jgi:hypothetical protein
MTFGHFSYTITIILFAGGAILIEWLVAYEQLKKYWKLIGLVVVMDLLILIVLEPTALQWRAWTLSPQLTLNVFFLGAAAETYIYTVLVSIAIASATLLWSDYEEAGLSLTKASLGNLLKKFGAREN